MLNRSMTTGLGSRLFVIPNHALNQAQGLRFRDLGLDLGEVRFLKPRSVSGILYCQPDNRESLAATTQPAPVMISEQV